MGYLTDKISVDAEEQIHKTYAHFREGILKNITVVLCRFDIDKNSRDGENKSQHSQPYFIAIAEVHCGTFGSRIVL